MTRQASAAARPGMRFFEGLKVVDLTQVWIGPMMTRILSDLGADVIKIERTETPDTVRSGFLAGNNSSGDFWNNRSQYFAARNAGKRAMQLDLRSEQGREILMRLLEDADIMAENFTPGAIRRMGLGYDDLKERFPRLVYVSMSGYGQEGPLAHRKAVGMSMEPASGAVAVTGYPGEDPLKTGQTWVDHYAGLHATAAVITALIYRQRSGRGQYVDISMQEATIPTLGRHLADYLVNGREKVGGDGNRRPGMVRGAYPCEGDDNYVAISARDEAEWSALCGVLGSDEWRADPRFASADARWGEPRRARRVSRRLDIAAHEVRGGRSAAGGRRPSRSGATGARGARRSAARRARVLGSAGADRLGRGARTALLLAAHRRRVLRREGPRSAPGRAHRRSAARTRRERRGDRGAARGRAPSSDTRRVWTTTSRATRSRCAWSPTSSWARCCVSTRTSASGSRAARGSRGPITPDDATREAEVLRREE